MYIKHALFEPYVVVGVFNSSHEAHKHLDETYKGFPHKVLSLKSAIAQAKREDAKQKRKQVKRKELAKKTKKYLAGVGQNVYEIQQRGYRFGGF